MKCDRSLSLLSAVLAQVAELRNEVRSLSGEMSGDGKRLHRELDRIERQAWRLLNFVSPFSQRSNH